MSIFDAIKNSVLEQFSTAVTVEGIIISVIVSFAISLFIDFIYRNTYSGVVYNRTTSLTIMLLSMTTAMIIQTINSNLSLSLGMVGALSIVRFRTAIKEPVDTAFLFWAITAGIMCGASLYLIAVVGSLVVGLCYYLLYFRAVKNKSQYLLVITCASFASKAVEEKIETIKNKKLKSKSAWSNGQTEITYEISYNKEIDELIEQLQMISGVKSVNIVTYNSEYGL